MVYILLRYPQRKLTFGTFQYINLFNRYDAHNSYSSIIRIQNTMAFVLASIKVILYSLLRNVVPYVKTIDECIYDPLVGSKMIAMRNSTLVKIKRS